MTWLNSRQFTICVLKSGSCTHPGQELLYEFHANQTEGDPDNVLVHVLGHWRLTATFHDLVFMPSVVVSRIFEGVYKAQLIRICFVWYLAVVISKMLKPLCTFYCCLTIFVSK